MDKKQIIFDFLNQCKTGVIATVNKDSLPEAALIGFGQTQDLVLVFGTKSTTRKYKNLQTNPSIAFVAGDDEQDTTVQYAGKAAEIFAEDAKNLKDLYFAKVPSAKKFANDANNRYFQVIPTWIRYSDLSSDDVTIFEVTF